MKSRSLIFALLISFSSHIFANSLTKPINEIINKVDPNINMGMIVLDLNTGETLYTRDASKNFTPASNMKLFSEAAALIFLGPSYTFQTKLSTNAKSLKNGILDGSLYLSLSGDPSLRQLDLKYLFAKLADWKVKEIKDDVVIVTSKEQINPHAPGVNPKDFTHSYGAPTTPFILDENRVIITVNPSSKAEQNALIEYSSIDNSFILDNQVKTRLKGVCGISAKVTKENKLKLRGCILKSSPAIQLSIPISNPLNYAQNVIRNQLKSLGIKLDGEIRIGKISKSNMLIAIHSSKPITQLMANTLKYSDNLYADSLFLHTAEEINGSSLNWQEAEPVVKKFLQTQTGVNFDSAVLIDGSGLSVHDRVTPLQTIGLLKYIHTHFPLAYEYITALPIAGQDGTLVKRFRKPTQRGLLRAKTGSLTGVMSLSGYLYTSNDHTLAFTIYINTRPGTKPNISGRYMGMVDSLCNFLLRQRPGNTFVKNLSNSNKHVAFQDKPSKADRIKSNYAKWRGIERSLKSGLQNDATNILFRNNSIIIVDNNKNPEQVWQTLQSIKKKYSFSIGLREKNPNTSNNLPVFLWIDNNTNGGQRVWYIQEAVS
ncbi:MAG: D-alanyl-D-alanine carboxypeptidase/D-alanyl-D-alanine-endopeptidase [Legionellales bacterium RIFCSPHIGHO2_12_FULL_35_11]|nr:MAG: D-alanyl-D-alanine carboxypeptidase/D-alanyl-D-alanine-endopeptidase [Legionellales bacterium RIFCSPHIGHO2_12_FULL_35_11]